jgi:hypothetical protein
VKAAKPDYYVYQYLVDGVLWYVGAGSGRRAKQHMNVGVRTNGQGTHIRAWHRQLALAKKHGAKIEVRKVSEKLTRAQAAVLELEMIQKLRPIKNIYRVPGMPHQTTRMLKLACGGCGYTVRTTEKWLKTGVPTCHCGALFVVLEKAPRRLNGPS